MSDFFFFGGVANSACNALGKIVIMPFQEYALTLDFISLTIY